MKQYIRHCILYSIKRQFNLEHYYLSFTVGKREITNVKLAKKDVLYCMFRLGLPLRDKIPILRSARGLKGNAESFVDKTK